MRRSTSEATHATPPFSRRHWRERTVIRDRTTDNVTVFLFDAKPQNKAPNRRGWGLGASLSGRGQDADRFAFRDAGGESAAIVSLIVREREQYGSSLGDDRDRAIAPTHPSRIGRIHVLDLDDLLANQCATQLGQNVGFVAHGGQSIALMMRPESSRVPA